MHRLDLGLYSHPKEFLGEWSLNPCQLQEKNPLYRKMSPEEDRTRDTVDSEPKHYQLSYSGPALTYAHRSRWSIGHLRPLAIAPCSGLFWPFQTSCLLVRYLTSQQQASVSQGRICSDKFTCCHTEIEVADPTFYLNQSQYTDTGPTSTSADPITPGAWQRSHWSVSF